MGSPEQIRPADRVKVADYIDLYRSFKLPLVEWASMERWRGYSYRRPPFQVGCSVLADLSAGPLFKDSGHQVYSGHNFTKEPAERKGPDKRCAERNAIEDALADGGFIIAIVTSSMEVSTGGEENRSKDVLHPCRECRGMLRELRFRGILSGEAIVCSTRALSSRVFNPEFIAEERTVDELLSVYKDDPGQPRIQGLFYPSPGDAPSNPQRIDAKKRVMDIRFEFMDEVSD